MLDERSLRRPTFTEGHQVALGDGQEWTFPKVVLRLVPRLDPDGSIKVGEGPPYGADYQVELNRLLDGCDDTPEGRYREIEAMMQLAAKLLLRNYDLSFDQLSALLYYDVDGSTAEMWRALDRVVVGLAPKPSAVGSD